ncbi:MAG: hypothetical protein ACM31P_02220 [Actinomycetota bacterium]
MGEHELQVHEACTAHSGMESRSKTILWLLGIIIPLIIVIGGGQFAILLDMKQQIGGFTYRFTAADESDKALREKMSILEQRMLHIESRLNGEPR